MNRRLIVLMFWLAGFAAVMAQAPEGFSFQAAVRDNSGQIAANKVVNVKISVLQGADSGTEVYSEFHSVRTNANGLVSLVVGEGSNPSGALSEIDWKSGGPYFLKMEADVNGGMDYQLVATTQLLSVPYALHAQSAGSLDGTVAFEQVTGVPDDWGFSGSWNDLKDRPTLFTGSWNDLTDVPQNIGFSGEYNDLNGAPDLQDSIIKYGFDGTWKSLEGKPDMFSGRYRDLIGTPSIRDSVYRYRFSGIYGELTGTPDFLRDSLPVWNDSIDYLKLKNRPNLSTDGAFSGVYDDLVGKPEIDEIAQDVFDTSIDTLRYSSLKELPSIVDSVAKYGFSGKWDDVIDKPDLNSQIIRNYNSLDSLPNLRDTVLKYAPEPSEVEPGVSSWNDLADKPSLPDTVAKYGFSGEYTDLKNRPTGNTDGDILYWQNDTWNALPMGQEGQMLTIAGGKLAWIDPSFTTTAANTYSAGEIYMENDSAIGIVVEVSSVGRYATIAELTERKVQWASGPSFVITNAQNQRDGQANTKKIREMEDWQSQYPAFASRNDEGWYLPSQNELSALFNARVKANENLAGIENAQPISRDIYWSSTELYQEYANGLCFNDTTVEVEYEEVNGVIIKDTITLLGGSYFETHKSDMLVVRMFKRLTWAEATSRPEPERIYRVGDVYADPATSQPLGIVYQIYNGGRNGKIINLVELDSTTWQDAQDAIAGWRVPTAEEWDDIVTQRFTINASMINHLKNHPTATPVANSGKQTTYWSSTPDPESESEEEEIIQPSIAIQFNVDGSTEKKPLSQTDKLSVRLIREY